MIMTSLQSIRKQTPCIDGWKRLLLSLDKTKPDIVPLPLLHILDSNGLPDAVWALRSTCGYERVFRLFSVRCGKYALTSFEARFPSLKEPRKAMQHAEREMFHDAWQCRRTYKCWFDAEKPQWASPQAVLADVLPLVTAPFDAEDEAERACKVVKRCAVSDSAIQNMTNEFILLCNLEGPYSKIDLDCNTVFVEGLISILPSKACASGVIELQS